ncbi:MAG: PAS domain-containing sensor histidine kinase [Candidatus Magnetoovum sp. WYHC-5]|nr:PAS domain-containing sensor histidine kinase [Candidatus Magnetoovum sp. WYHC-5]
MANNHDYRVKNVGDELRLYKLIVENSPSSIIVTDAKGNIEYANPQFCILTGYCKEEIYGKNPRILKSGQTPRHVYKELWETITAGKQWQGEFLNRKKNGELYWEFAKISPVTDSNGIVANYIAIKDDITEKKVMEAKLHEFNRNLEERVKQEIENGKHKERLLMEQSKLAAMGEMIGAIAHQWRQPLNSLGLLIQDIPDAFEFGEMDKTYIDSIVAKVMVQIQYMSSTIDDFRNFFLPSKQKIQFKLVDAIDEAISLIYSQIKNNYIDISVAYDGTFSTGILGYPNEFKQVIINLINNARDSIIEKRKKSQNPEMVGHININLEPTFQQNKHYIVINFSDDGIGIPNNLISRIYEPYFTTKEQGKGTGLGLYMAKTIIEKNMAGKLSVINNKDGATFVIILPTSDNNHAPLEKVI